MDYESHYHLLISKHGSSTKPDGYSERHHIVPKCLGGSDDENNLVYLSAEAHYVAHQLLVKMNPGHYGVSYAAMLMVRAGRGRGRVNNKYYSWLKKRFCKLQSLKASVQMLGNNRALGYKHSEKTRSIISKLHKGKPKKEETKARISAALKGRSAKVGWTHSEETKAKIREALTGRKFSEESKTKMRLAKCKKNQ